MGGGLMTPEPELTVTAQPIVDSIMISSGNFALLLKADDAYDLIDAMKVALRDLAERQGRDD